MPNIATSPDATSNIIAAGVELHSVDGAIAVQNGSAFITKTSLCALTLAKPVASTDDGNVLRIIATTAYAHTITTPANGVNGASTTLTLNSSPPAAGNAVKLIAYNGSWYVSDKINCTVT